MAKATRVMGVVGSSRPVGGWAGVAARWVWDREPVEGEVRVN